MLYFVDACRDKTIVHKIDYENGEYIESLKLKGFWNNQCVQLITHIHDDGCSKIIFDREGFGKGFYDRFKLAIDNDFSSIEVDNSGNITLYKTEEYLKRFVE